MALSKRLCNHCLSTLMIAQVLLWIYICLGTTKTKSPDTTVNIAARNHLAPWNGVLGTGSLNKARRVQSDQIAPIDAPQENQPDILQVQNHEPERKVMPLLVPIPTTSMNTDEIMKEYFNAQLGHTILPRDPSFVLYGEFLKNPANLCRQHEDLDLVVVVHTAPYNFQRRHRLRQVFHSPEIVSPYTVQLVFTLGTLNASTSDPVKHNIFETEYNTHGDIIQMDFQENFRNLSYKAVTWLRWLDSHCSNAMMVLKIDDDVILDVRRVLPLARGLFSKYKMDHLLQRQQTRFSTNTQKGENES